MSVKDKISATDKVSATLETVPTVPRDPCPKCGKAMKEHHNGGRICANPLCRFVTEPLN